MHFYYKRKNKLSLAIFFLILYYLFSFNSSLSYALDNISNDESITIYQKNREAFFVQQKNERVSFQNQVSSLQTEIESLKQKISEKNEELDRHDSVIANKIQSIRTYSRIQAMASSFLFPLLSMYSMTISFFTSGEGTKILLIFVCITVLNLFIYLFRRQSLFFQQYKTFLIVAVILLIGSIALPVFADVQTNREQVINSLQSAQKMLSLSEHERFIAILEKKTYQQINLPSLQSGDPLFEVIPQVKIDTPEYWYTLAALYTHERKTGKAIDAVKKITSESRLSDTQEHRKIIINSIKYLIQEHQTQLAGEVVDSLSENVMDVTAFLDLATFLRENGMQASAAKISVYIINRTSNVKELVKLSQFFISQNELDKSDEALGKAINLMKNIDDALLLGDAAIAANKEVLIEKLITAVDKVTNDDREKIKLVDLFHKYDRKEEATKLFSKIIKDDTSRTRFNVDRLLFLIDAALKRNFLPEASNATELLIIILDRKHAETFQVNFETRIKSAEGIPNIDRILLPHFYGLINEEQGIHDKAEDAYIHSVIGSLSTILESYGYNYPESLNDFFLLGRIWIRENRGDLIGILDRVYSIIEKQSINQQSIENKKQIDSMQNEVNELQEKYNEVQSEVSKKKKDVSKVYKKLIFQVISTIASVIFIIVAIIGCLIISYQYCINLSVGKSFGFATKFIETTGWLQIMSIIGVISGFINVLVGQFFQIFQTIQENTRKVSFSFPLRHLPVSRTKGEEQELSKEPV